MKLIHTILFTLLAATLSLNALAEEKEQKTEEATHQNTDDSKCQAPAWAIAIGHEQMWKKHNGCEDKNEDKQKDEHK